jgi:hypothetical protein
MKLHNCPTCTEPLRVTAKRCDVCALELRADFEEGPLVSLSRDEQEFLLEFILCGGNFRALSERLDLTYPTLRSRLDRIIARLQQAAPTPDQILDEVSGGALSPDEAIRELRKIGRKGVRG